MDLEPIVTGVQSRTGHADRAPLESGTQTTLRVLGAHLGGVPPALHDAIADGLHPALQAGTEGDAVDPAQAYQRVADETGLRVGLALEVVQSVVAELAATLTEPARVTLREALPADWAALVLDPPPRSQVPIKASTTTDDGSGHTLATGRPGGGQPLADASPARGQSNSVAASDDPHAERLAAASGPGPQRPDGTLAAGHPGSDRPVSDAD